MGVEDNWSNPVEAIVELHARELYEEVLEFASKLGQFEVNKLELEVEVNTKYKTVAKKVKPVATQLPPNTLEHIAQAAREPSLRETRRIGHKFT